MGTGTLKVEASTAFHALPVAGAQVTVRDGSGRELAELWTDENGVTGPVELEAPDAAHTLSPEDPGPYYATCTVTVSAPGFDTATVHGVQIFDGELSVLPVQMLPAQRLAGERSLFIPPTALDENPAAWLQEGPEEGILSRRGVYIPESVVVHLGAPASSARNVRIGFADYIKNVASSEIYPTWPEQALRANIHCQISFALNRVYTEWYPSRGYPFHITSSTAYDQSFVEGRNIFANISALVDEIFNEFVQRPGHGEPYFTQYCNGTTVTCRGLSQWGTVPLAQQGLDAPAILRSYYPADIRLVQSADILGIRESYPGSPLREGAAGEEVRLVQTRLNRIRVNYPLIPAVASPDGTFGADTAAAVKTFQRTFDLAADGIVGKATWYKILSIYNGVKKLADLDSEGERIGIGAAPPTGVIREGSRGGDVLQLQFLLNYTGEFYSDIPLVLENSLFDALTKASVLAFQRKYGLAADGVVGPATWQTLYDVYHGIAGSLTPPPDPGPAPEPGGQDPYPGTLLRAGSRGEAVRTVQRRLNSVFRGCPGYRPLTEDGLFGARTEEAVRAFQITEELAADGIVGPETWERLAAGAYSCRT